MLSRLLPCLSMVALVACGTAARGNGPVLAGSPSPTLAAQTLVIDGGNTILRYAGGKNGSLRIDVESRHEPTGAVKTTVTYTRSGPCRKEPVGGGNSVVTCPVLWTVDHHVGADAFKADTLLNTASFTDTLRGQKVTATWTGYGDTTRQENANGNLHFEMRNAKGDVRWGSAHYVDPKNTQSPSSLFRRVPKP